MEVQGQGHRIEVVGEQAGCDVERHRSRRVTRIRPNRLGRSRHRGPQARHGCGAGRAASHRRDRPPCTHVAGLLDSRVHATRASVCRLDRGSLCSQQRHVRRRQLDRLSVHQVATSTCDHRRPGREGWGFAHIAAGDSFPTSISSTERRPPSASAMKAACPASRCRQANRSEETRRTTGRSRANTARFPRPKASSQRSTRPTPGEQSACDAEIPLSCGSHGTLSPGLMRPDPMAWRSTVAICLKAGVSRSCRLGPAPAWLTPPDACSTYTSADGHPRRHRVSTPLG